MASTYYQQINGKLYGPYPRRHEYKRMGECSFAILERIYNELARRADEYNMVYGTARAITDALGLSQPLSTTAFNDLAELGCIERLIKPSWRYNREGMWELFKPPERPAWEAKFRSRPLRAVKRTIDAQLLGQQPQEPQPQESNSARTKRRYVCGNCGELGHNTRTCKAGSDDAE